MTIIDILNTVWNEILGRALVASDFEADIDHVVIDYYYDDEEGDYIEVVYRTTDGGGGSFTRDMTPDAWARVMLRIDREVSETLGVVVNNESIELTLKKPVPDQPL